MFLSCDSNLLHHYQRIDWLRDNLWITCSNNPPCVYKWVIRLALSCVLVTLWPIEIDKNQMWPNFRKWVMWNEVLYRDITNQLGRRYCHHRFEKCTRIPKDHPLLWHHSTFFATPLELRILKENNATYKMNMKCRAISSSNYDFQNRL